MPDNHVEVLLEDPGAARCQAGRVATAEKGGQCNLYGGSRQ